MRSNALATPLVRDVELDVDVAELRMGAWDTEEVRKLFGFLEFRTLWDRLLEAVGPEQAAGPAVTTTAVLEADVTVVRSPSDAAALFERLAKTSLAPPAIVSTHPDPGDRAEKAARAAEHAHPTTTLPSPKGLRCK